MRVDNGGRCGSSRQDPRRLIRMRASEHYMCIASRQLSFLVSGRRSIEMAAGAFEDPGTNDGPELLLVETPTARPQCDYYPEFTHCVHQGLLLRLTLTAPTNDDPPFSELGPLESQRSAAALPCPSLAWATSLSVVPIAVSCYRESLISTTITRTTVIGHRAYRCTLNKSPRSRPEP